MCNFEVPSDNWIVAAGDECNFELPSDNWISLSGWVVEFCVLFEGRL